MKSFWKQFAELVTALKASAKDIGSRPLRNAGLKLTILYVLHAFIILAVFITILGYARFYYLEKYISGKLGNHYEEVLLVRNIWSDLQGATVLLGIGVLLAIGIISYYSVRMTLRPIRTFIEAHRRFIADASHELRTPLATMRTEIEVALLDPGSMPKEELVDLLRSNVDEIDRMSKILTNLLNLAAFNDASGGPAFAPVDLGEIARHTIERVRHIMVAKNITIQEHIESVEVHGNAVALEEVIFNLLKNAVHYSHDGGTVSLDLMPVDNEAELVISDSGVGIVPEDMPHVFEPFYRSERSLHMYTTGSGLGLPLAKEIIERHKGSIRIDSEPKIGTTVTVTLPLAKESS